MQIACCVNAKAENFSIKKKKKKKNTVPNIRKLTKGNFSKYAEKKGF